MFASAKLVADFSKGCAGGRFGYVLFVTHHRRPAIRGWFHANAQRPVNLTPANAYSLLQHLVVRKRP